ncbi:CHAT domain-containing protein [Archangium lipolyticum]|uniref:CHAT domain-containing protein n=1 Tax=Archangium lipolyticum TaxID=2970465 RepID=UPI00214A68BC|nr:CHAT domain-containing protein [Archangium lipolyticum]
MATVIKDVVVLLPGLLGSVLERGGKEIWGLSGGAFLRALVSRGGSVESLELKSDSGGEFADDGVRATKLIPDVQLLPGFWKIDGYTQVARTLESRLNLIPGANFFTFPYDWRRDIRITAKRLAHEAQGWLYQWRKSRGGSPDARLILVGHSMGGLVARYFLECLGGWEDTRALITFGTPHRGSLMALQALSLGFRKDFGPFKLLDLSAMVRSLPSAYQLLPIYPCVQMPDGSLARPGEAKGIPNLDPVRAAAGLAFQREILAAVESNSKSSKYLERGYSLHPVVGTFQPTLQGAKLGPKGLEMLYTLPGGQDLGGDSTVPHVSAMPVEERAHASAMFNSTSHASLQNAFEVLAHVEGVLKGQRIDLNAFRSSSGMSLTPRSLSLFIEDAYAHDEPVTVRVRPSEEPVSLKAFVTNADTQQSFQVELKPGKDGLHEGTLPALPPGMYRVIVKGGPEVIPVANVFAVFPGESELSKPGTGGGDERSPRRSWPPVTSAQPLMSDPSLDEFLPDLKSWVVPVAGERDRSDDTPWTPMSLSAPRDEGQTIVRHPAVKPLDPARPGQLLRLSVDLLLGPLDPDTESAGLTVSNLPADWRELPIKVRLLCSELTFEPGSDTGVVMVQRNKKSIATTLSGTVNPNADGELTVVATFEYGGRFCGAARRVIPIEPGGAGLPGPSTSTSSSGAASRGGEQDLKGRSSFAIEVDAEKPHLTVQIHRLDKSNPRRLYWMLQVPVDCEELPSRLSGEVDLGSDPAALFQSVANAAREQRPGEHYDWFLGLGKLLYERTPAAFQETFRALRRQYGKGFPIQFITDDPYVPWELMAPSDVPEAGLLCVQHPVARWFLDYQTSLTARLPKGEILTIAPDYQYHSHLAPLPGAQEESRQLMEDFNAIRVPGSRKRVLSVLKEGQFNAVGLLHFAGHGKYSGNAVTPSCIYLEDGKLETLEIRNPQVVLGRKFRPLVLFNACEVGAATDMLGGVGGWAEAFVSERFSGFIAPLWPVQDAHARAVAAKLVKHWKNGMTMGEALRSLREEEAHESPTYLSYVFVGDVMARLPQVAVAGAAGVAAA